MVLKSEKNSPMLSPPSVCHLPHPLSTMSNAVQREAGGGSCLSQHIDSSHGVQQKNSTTLLLLCSSFTSKTSPYCHIFHPISCLAICLILLSNLPLSQSVLLSFVSRGTAIAEDYDHVTSSLFIYFILFFGGLME